MVQCSLEALLLFIELTVEKWKAREKIEKSPDVLMWYIPHLVLCFVRTWLWSVTWSGGDTDRPRDNRPAKRRPLPHKRKSARTEKENKGRGYIGSDACHIAFQLKP